MALKLTDNLRDQIRTPNPNPTMVAEIDGYLNKLSNVKLKRNIRIGDAGLIIGNDWVIGGFTDLENVDALLQMDSGTTTKLVQKSDPSRGQSSSVTQMALAILDYNELATELVSPNFILTEILGKRVTIRSGALETSYPEDYNIVFRGTIQSLKSSANTVLLILSGTDEKKRVSVSAVKQVQTNSELNYRSVTFQDILYINRTDLVNQVTITYVDGGSAGSEVVSLLSTYSIQVLIDAGASTASHIKKAIENSALSNQLVTVKINGNSSAFQGVGSAILGIDTVVSGDFSSFIEPQDILTTLATVKGELLQYANKSSTQLTGVARAVQGEAEYLSTDKTVNQVLRFQDHGINIALKLMISGSPEYYLENLKVKSFQFYSISIIIDNALFFDVYDLEQEHGIVAGDTITITLATNGVNNVVDAIVQEIGQAGNGSYIILSQDLFTEGTTNAVAKFKSKYNTLPIGMSMLPKEIDILQHEYVRDVFLPIFPMDIKTKEIEDGKKFLDEEIYKPMACYSVPRKGRSSLVHTTAPLPNYEVITIDTSTCENPAALQVQRSTNENFVNQIQFDYDFDVITGDYKTHKNYPENVDKSIIDVGAKPLILKSKGMTTLNGALDVTNNMADKYLRRYSVGADFIKGIEVSFAFGYQLEIGDVVAVDYSSLKLSDFSSGNRSGIVKLMEITNKTLDLKTLQVMIDVVNTIFGFGDRYGLISPASLVDIGSTTGQIKLQKSWSTKPFQLESTKYKDYIGQNIVVRTDDFSQVYYTKIRGFDTGNPQGMSIDPIAASALENWIVECVPYPNDIDQRVEEFWKNRHAFFSPQIQVLTGLSQTVFDVANIDISQFFVGSFIRVHNYNYSDDSKDVKVIDITGDTITVNKMLGFIPSNIHFIDLIGFPDKQQAYRLV
jgi:hypothetical protein